MNRLLDRLEFLQGLAMDRPSCPVCRHTASRASGDKGNGISPVIYGIFQEVVALRICGYAVEWRSAIADAAVETHDRIVGKTWREAKSRCDTRADDAKAALGTLHAFHPWISAAGSA